MLVRVIGLFAGLVLLLGLTGCEQGGTMDQASDAVKSIVEDVKDKVDELKGGEAAEPESKVEEEAEAKPEAKPEAEPEADEADQELESSIEEKRKAMEEKMSKMKERVDEVMKGNSDKSIEEVISEIRQEVLDMVNEVNEMDLGDTSGQ